MSQTIDSRVVEMRFDNKQFEQGAKTTMNTLQRLKEALKLPDAKKSLEGLDNAVQKVSLEGIAAAVDQLNQRFSTLGIVGMRVIQNLTDGFMNQLHKAITFTTDAIVSGGVKRAMNIENAHFQLQALLKDEVKVQAVMADAMESVDGTAYAYDEAAKAAAQFSASGIQAGDEMLGALKGITGVAAMTNSSFENISMIFTTVAGNGRLMGDQLLQLSSRGLNAASTIADYFREVRGQAGMTEGTIREMVSKGQISFKDFSDAMTWAFGDSAKRANETFTGAMSNMKSALARIGAGFISPLIEQNGVLVQLFNALRIKINDVKSALVFDEQRSAIAGLAETTKMSNDELTEMFSTIKSNGKVTVADLDRLTNKGADATAALTKYVNGVTDGSIRASYAITSALGDLTEGTQVSTADIKRFVEEGKIDLATFTAAMEKEFGTEKTLSKQFTDWFQDMVANVVTAVNNLDVTRPMEVFYYWLEAVKNVVKGLFSVVKPIGEAFADVFLSFNADQVVAFSDSIRQLTSKMKLSEYASKNLHDAMEGLFNVGKLLLDIAFSLIKIIVPLNRPVVTLSGGVLELVGAIGRLLTKFTTWIRSSKLFRRSFEAIGDVVSFAMDALVGLIQMVQKFIDKVMKLDGVTKFIDAVGNAFTSLGKFVRPYIEDFIDELESLADSMFAIDDINFDDVLNNISSVFSDFADTLNGIDFSKPKEVFEVLKQSAKEFAEVLKSNEGIMTFVTNMKEFGHELNEAFTLDNLMDRMERIMDVFGKFFNWIKDTLGPIIANFDVGSAVAAGGGLGLVYALIKMSKSFERISGSIKAIPDLLGGVKDTLVAYQKDLKADSILKVSIAIGVLAAALTFLSFADPDRLLDAAMALALVAGVLMYGVTKMLEALNKGREIPDALNTFAKGLSGMMKNLGKAVKIKALGSAVSDIGSAIVKIAISIIALGIMYKKDKDALMAGVDLVKWIGIALGGVMLGMSVIANFLKTGTKNFLMAALGVLFITNALKTCVRALSMLFKMDIPEDWENRVEILERLLGSVAVLTVLMGAAAGFAGDGKVSGFAILSMAVLLMAAVMALQKIYEMELPPDSELKKKNWILVGLFGGIAALMIAMGAAAKLAGGTMKVAGAILAMAIFVAVVVGALAILSIFPADKLLVGAGALGIVLVGLAVALLGASKVAKPDVYKSILAMAVAVGAITASLAILSLIPWPKLVVSAATLGVILGVLAADLNYASKGSNQNAWLTVAAMVAAVLGIGLVLVALAPFPWKQILAAGVALSGVLGVLAMSFAFLDSADVKPEQLAMFLVSTLALIPITLALRELATNDWQSLLAAGAALTAVLVAMAASFAIVSATKPDPMAMAAFLVASISVCAIALSLAELAKQPWENLLASAAALAIVLVSISVALGLCTVLGGLAPAAIAGIVVLDLFVANFAALLYALGKIFQSEETKAFLSGGAEVLAQLGEAIGNFIGSIVSGALTKISSALPQIGLDLSMFMTNLTPFILGSKLIDAGVLESVGYLTGAILALTAAELINGISRFLGFSLVGMAVELSNFMVALTPFIMQSRILKPESMQACLYLADMILALTGAELLNGIGRIFGLSGSLADFGEELAAFGPSIKEFAEDVKDVKPEAVQGAAAAAQIMADLADKLPATGGFAQKVFGRKSLAMFGVELKSFGPNIRDFAEDVKDVKPEAVQGAAGAAQIMSDLADKLPTTGGFAQKIFGTKSIAEFGIELKSFGKHIKEFAEEVQSVTPLAVTGAAAAAQIMSTLANNLPSSESLKEKIFGGGQLSLSQFGDELILFAESMSNFSDTLGDINIIKITNLVAGFKQMVDLSNYLGDSTADGIVNFATQIGNIGTESMNEFINSFSEAGSQMKIQITALFTSIVISMGTQSATLNQTAVSMGSELCSGLRSGIVSQTASVIAAEMSLVTNMVNTLQTGIPANSMKTSGQNLIQSFIDGFSSKKPLAILMIGNTCIQLTNQFRTGMEPNIFSKIAQGIIDGVITGMSIKRPILMIYITNLCIAITNQFRVGLPRNTFETFGSNVILWIIQGMRRQIDSISPVVTQACNTITQSFRSNLSQSVFTEIGAMAAMGLKIGIESKIQEIANSAILVSRAVVDASRRTFDENSPSKVAIGIGEYFSMGLAIGIANQIREVAAVGKKAADEAIEPVKDVVYNITDILNSTDFNMDPVIRPVMDLSDIQNGANEIASMMNRTYDLSPVYNKVMDTAASFSRNHNSSMENGVEGRDQKPTEMIKYEFIQNNYSPKALSRTDIYRQTSNQFSSFQRKVATT